MVSVSSAGRALAVQDSIPGLMPNLGMWDGYGCKVWQGGFFQDLLIPVWVIYTNTDRTFPLEAEHSDSALVLCNMLVIMLVKHVCVYTRIHSGEQEKGH